MSNQITGYARRTLPTLLIFVLLAAPATLIAPQPALAAPTFTVNSAADVVASAPLNNGVCQTALDNNACTLRAAIMKANHFPGGGVKINIPSGTYTLIIPKFDIDDEATGNLNISADMSIIGAGATSTIIDGNGSAMKDNVISVSTGVTVTISNVSIQNGRADFGGGISNNGNLTLTNSVVSGNNASSGGGGITNDNNGTLRLTNSVVSGNNASIFGGGISIMSGATSMLINSTIRGNSAGQYGGGIFNEITLNVINSTISANNVISGGGGGIYNGSTLKVINSTISGNNSATDGGGIGNLGTSNLFNTTIAFNQADSDLNGSGTGGGIWNDNGATFNFTNSIIALNYGTAQFLGFYNSVPRDCSGTLTSQGNNIVYTDTACIINGSITLADPLLAPLQNNGGATLTHALLPGSPAVDAGDTTLGGCKDNLGATLATDQRGALRPVNGGIALRCDIGAYEYLAKIPQTIAFSPLANKTLGDPSFSVSATATSGLAVTFTAAGQCNVVGSLVTLTGAGGCAVTAHQAGNSNYSDAPDVTRSFAISAKLYLPLIVK